MNKTEKKLEAMGAFFNDRADGYENHMMKNVDGADKFYVEVANLLPISSHIELLDLGCGTGLEIDEIVKLSSNISVTGVDLSEEMLVILRGKYRDKNTIINLIKADYFELDFGCNTYDVVVSVMSLHHFKSEKKISLYKKIFNCLRNGGVYIEADYMAPTQEYEDFYFAENNRIRAKQGITEGFFHYDTPYTVSNQIGMLQTAGFQLIENVWNYGNTTILKCIKEI